MEAVRWGVLGAARIATGRVIPAMQASALCSVRALAARDVSRARSAAAAAAVPVVHDSYEALLADPDIEAVYLPLPNDLHVHWSVAALRAGKHVLCEKPIALHAEDVHAIIAARDASGLLAEEAFMVRDHPQWALLGQLVQAGRIGEPRLIEASYCHTVLGDRDIRLDPQRGGGALYDVGCYACAVSRMVLRREPRRVLAHMLVDPRTGIDQVTVACLDFGDVQASFTASIAASRHQQLTLIGTDGWIRVEVPFAHPPHLAARLVLGVNEAPGTEPVETITLEPVNQYRLQAERFSRLVRGEPARAWPLEDAMANMRVIDALQRAAFEETWAAVS